MGEVLKNLVDDLRRNHQKEDADALILVDELMRAYAFTSDSLSKEATELSKSMRKLVAEWIAGDLVVRKKPVQWELSGNADNVDWGDIAQAGRAYADNLLGEPAVSKVMHMMADEIERLREVAVQNT